MNTTLQVEKFLEEIRNNDSEKYKILQELRTLVKKTHPKVTERIMYGGIMFTLDADWGGIYPSKNHVSFEFSQGFALNDTNNHLEGSGKFRRHLKIESIEDIQSKEVESFVKQIG